MRVKNAYKNDGAKQLLSMAVGKPRVLAQNVLLPTNLPTNKRQSAILRDAAD
jgi:hypothetical protein